jgi:hypothetical protein
VCPSSSHTLSYVTERDVLGPPVYPTLVASTPGSAAKRASGFQNHPTPNTAVSVGTAEGASSADATGRREDADADADLETRRGVRARASATPTPTPTDARRTDAMVALVSERGARFSSRAWISVPTRTVRFRETKNPYVILYEAAR